jgi:integrase
VNAKRARSWRVQALLNRAIAIVGEAESLSDFSGLVFPGTSQGKILSDITLSKLAKELGFDADV